MCSRLLLGTAVIVLTIVLRLETRNAEWILMIIGSVIIYIDAVYSALELFGIAPRHSKLLGSVPLLTILLTALCAVLVVIALIIMVARR